MLIVPALLLIGARKPPPPSGDLALDTADPVIAVEIQRVPMRLRVDLDRQDSIELNPAAAARLAVPWYKGDPLEVGRVRLPNQVAGVLLKVGRRTVPAEVSQHGRDCCAGVDGVIGPDLLPFATVRWRNVPAPAPTAEIVLPLEASETTGLSAASDAGNVRLRFALGAPETIATAAAGATLARLWGGRWNGPERRVTLVFGITRPARPMAFSRPGKLAGFAVDQLLVRLSDFGGDAKLPADPAQAGEFVIAHRLERQSAWPAVTIGADRLSRCAEIVYSAVPRSLTLRCAFEGP
ncbi:MAG: hypothetical protein JF615_12210 [Asticcacaulis sp.]|nr:hypothetical protein [Asticcacaulis sp.]